MMDSFVLAIKKNPKQKKCLHFKTFQSSCILEIVEDVGADLSGRSPDAIKGNGRDAKY